jgi:hypothetical protein
MIWQDVVLSIAQIVFFLALLPSVMGALPKPPAIMCLVTAVNLVACAIAQGTLALNGAALATGALALVWAWMGWDQSRPIYRGALPAIVFEWRMAISYLRRMFR